MIKKKQQKQLKFNSLIFIHSSSSQYVFLLSINKDILFVSGE